MRCASQLTQWRTPGQANPEVTGTKHHVTSVLCILILWFIWGKLGDSGEQEKHCSGSCGVCGWVWGCPLSRGYPDYQASFWEHVARGCNSVWGQSELSPGGWRVGDLRTKGTGCGGEGGGDSQHKGEHDGVPWCVREAKLMGRNGQKSIMTGRKIWEERHKGGAGEDTSLVKVDLMGHVKGPWLGAIQGL